MSMGETGLCIGCMSEMEDDGLCPLCGYDNNQPNARNYLQPGKVIASRYAVGALLSRNSEGGVYIGFDGETDHPVWIREYFPEGIARRDEDGENITPLPGFGAQYKALMSEFVDICNAEKRLGVSDSVIPIENVVIFHNTLYAVYRKMDVISLEAFFSGQGAIDDVRGSIPWKTAVRMFLPLCDTVTNMHARGDLHRGISPRTVFIDRNGKLWLWGFALAATRTGGSELEAELFSGYAAPEQYTSNGWQGPWTDVYAMAALFYRTVSGVSPPKSTLIGSLRGAVPLTDLIEDIPPNISGAIADAMGIAAGDRTQTMASFSCQLIAPGDMSSTASTAIYAPGVVQSGAREKAGKREPPGEDRASQRGTRRNRQVKESESGVSIKYILLALICTVLILGGALWFFAKSYLPDLIPVETSGSSSGSRESVVSEQESEPEEESSSLPESSQEEVDRTIPRFVGMSYDEITADSAYAARFAFEKKEEYNDNFEAGIVFHQTPAEGSLMANRGIVILTVSKGKRSVPMPDLAGMTLEEAQEIITGLEEEYDTVIPLNAVEQYQVGTEPGKIIRSMPAAGQEFDPAQTSVFVYVSLAPEISETKEESSSKKPESSSRAPAREVSRSSVPERDS